MTENIEKILIPRPELTQDQVKIWGMPAMTPFTNMDYPLFIKID